MPMALKATFGMPRCMSKSITSGVNINGTIEKTDKLYFKSSFFDFLTTP